MSELRGMLGWYIVASVISFWILLLSGTCDDWKTFIEVFLVIVISLAILIFGCYLITGGK